MKTVVFGKIIEKRHEIDAKVKTVTDENGKQRIVYTAKPEKKIKEEVTGHKEILRYKGEPKYSDKQYSLCSYANKTFNINADEEVRMEREIFRADLNEMHLYTNKVLEVNELYKDEIENVYDTYVKDFNEEMILSNDKMKSYCDLHKLVYEETDAIELFKMVYPGESYKIENGKMLVDYESLTKIYSPLFNDLLSFKCHKNEQLDKHYQRLY